MRDESAARASCFRTMFSPTTERDAQQAQAILQSNFDAKKFICGPWLRGSGQACVAVPVFIGIFVLVGLVFVLVLHVEVAEACLIFIVHRGCEE